MRGGLKNPRWGLAGCFCDDVGGSCYHDAMALGLEAPHSGAEMGDQANRDDF